MTEQRWSTTPTGFAKLVLVARGRRHDVAFPEHVLLTDVVAALLHRLADGPDGARPDRWQMRRTDGSRLDLSRPLAGQRVRDGDVLYVVPDSIVWPEPDYDDPLDPPAGRRRGWDPVVTRSWGLAAAAAAVPMVVVTLTRTGGSWLELGIVLLTLASILMAAGVALARTSVPALGSAVVGAAAPAYGFLGGFVVLGGDLPLSSFAAPQFAVGAQALLLLSLIGLVGLRALRPVYVAGVAMGLCGVVAAGLGLAWLAADRVAALLVVSVILVLPALPLLSVRLARVPMPKVPRDVAELIAPIDPVRIPVTLARVARSAEWLTGLLLGGAGVVLAGTCVLAWQGGAGLLLAAAAAAALLLRARLFVALAQRATLLCGGLAASFATVVIGSARLPVEWRLGLGVPALVLAALLVCAAGLIFDRRSPSPHLGRVADVLDVGLTLSLALLAALVLGLFAAMRGMAG